MRTPFLLLDKTYKLLFNMLGCITVATAAGSPAVATPLCLSQKIINLICLIKNKSDRKQLPSQNLAQITPMHALQTLILSKKQHVSPGRCRSCTCCNNAFLKKPPHRQETKRGESPGISTINRPYQRASTPIPRRRGVLTHADRPGTPSGTVIKGSRNGDRSYTPPVS